MQKRCNSITNALELLQERCNSIANALELHLSCTNPSICSSWKRVCEPMAPCKTAPHYNTNGLGKWGELWLAMYFASLFQSSTAWNGCSAPATNVTIYFKYLTQSLRDTYYWYTVYLMKYSLGVVVVCFFVVVIALFALYTIWEGLLRWHQGSCDCSSPCEVTLKDMGKLTLTKPQLYYNEVWFPIYFGMYWMHTFSWVKNVEFQIAISYIVCDLHKPHWPHPVKNMKAIYLQQHIPWCDLLY